MPITQSELLTQIHHSYSALEQTLKPLTDAQLTRPGPGGWSVKDHLTHLLAWENSMVFLLSGRARHLGLGVDEAMYLRGDDDEINAAVQRLHAARPPAEVLADFRATHQRMVEAIKRLSDADLLKVYSNYLPDEPGEETGEPICKRILGNTVEHFDEHRDYIQSLLSKS
jgi:uncharacterized protein (TIGR03083 family)